MVVFVGTVLGVIGMLLFTVIMDRGFATISDPAALGQIAPIFAPAVLIAGVAFAVYCALIKGALRKHAKESGAPNDAPRPLPWLEILVLRHLRVHVVRPGSDAAGEVPDLLEAVLCEEFGCLLAASAGFAVDDDLGILVELTSARG